MRQKAQFRAMCIDDWSCLPRMALIQGEAYTVKFYYRLNNIEANMVAKWRLDEFTQGATETELAQAFLLDFEVNTNAPIRMSNSSCYRVEVQETFGGLDYGVAEGDVLGIITTNPAPSFNAIAVRQNVGTRLVRPGQKRIPFISENQMNGNEPALTVGQQTALEVGYGQPIDIDWTSPTTGLFTFGLTPMVVGVTLDPVDGKYFLDPTKQVIVRNAEVTRVTSQNSRKY